VERPPLESPTASPRGWCFAKTSSSTSRERCAYLYHDGDPFLSTSAAKGSIQGQSHAFHYDVLFTRGAGSPRVRPYIAVGVGAKYYATTGPAPVPQPMPKIAGLAGTNQFRALFTGGAGVKYRLTDHILVRADVRDYVTAFPDAFDRAGGQRHDTASFTSSRPCLG